MDATPGSDQAVKFELDGAVATLTLNRPEKLNAFSRDTVEVLHERLESLHQRDDVRVVILRGEGRAFCSGTDLSTPLGSDTNGDSTRHRLALQKTVSSLVSAIRSLPQPVIAAIHGHAAGGGMSLALSCDIRIADVTAVFHAAFVRIGASGGDIGSSWFLPRLVGPGHAAEMLYTGRFVDAEEAGRIGLVNRVVPEGTHLDAARELADQILENAPLGTRMTKELLNASLLEPGLQRHLELENRTQILCTYTEDFVEGVAAFREQRRAVYRDA